MRYQSCPYKLNSLRLFVNVWFELNYQSHWVKIVVYFGFQSEYLITSSLH